MLPLRGSRCGKMSGRGRGVARRARKRPPHQVPGPQSRYDQYCPPGEDAMRRGLPLLVLLIGLGGCATHAALQRDTGRATNTLTDLQFEQVLDNVARFHDNPDTVPSFAVATAGTVSVNDQAGAGVSPTYSPTLRFSQ